MLVTTTGTPPSIASPGCPEYGVVAGRLYLPVEARLDPRALESEIADLIAGNDDDYIFHPSIGLVRIDQRERLGVADLLQPPPWAETDWNYAQPGIAPRRPLTSIEPETPPTSDEIFFDAAQDDIATEDLEQTSNRSSSAERSRSTSTGGGAIGHWLGNRHAETAPDANSEIRDGEHPWPSRKTKTSHRAVRNEPVDRLLQLLQDDPDEGLRYAVPLEGTPRRGSAPAGDQLTKRIVDFDLRGLAASGPAGTWEVSHQRLRHCVTSTVNLLTANCRWEGIGAPRISSHTYWVTCTVRRPH